MVIKVLISGISASKEIKKHQQRAQMLLDSLKIRYETIDITEPGHEEEKELMRTVCKKRNNNSIALPPQFFNDDRYCGDYEDLSLASDEDTVLSFLGLEEDITIENGDVSSSEGMNDQNDTNSVPNGDKSPDIADEGVGNDIMEEDTDETTVVTERLTINGQVVDIPIDKLLEIKGQKLDLNELLISKTKKIEESHSVVPKVSDSNDEINDNNQTIDENIENTDENQMNTEEEESKEPEEKVEDSEEEEEEEGSDEQ